MKKTELKRLVKKVVKEALESDPSSSDAILFLLGKHGGEMNKTPVFIPDNWQEHLLPLVQKLDEEAKYWNRRWEIEGIDELGFRSNRYPK